MKSLEGLHPSAVGFGRCRLVASRQGVHVEPQPALLGDVYLAARVAVDAVKTPGGEAAGGGGERTQVKVGGRALEDRVVVVEAEGGRDVRRAVTLEVVDYQRPEPEVAARGDVRATRVGGRRRGGGAVGGGRGGGDGWRGGGLSRGLR